ncbi:Cytochrome c [Anatilimnocola aggregata]|uniref:Cytochrome c n=1 Tax=Anatilimnocola aggregata TaxID=2528021 RepID=A0A517YJH0_9BACT|nr:PVC-type heme-binding CxxCH protein [Anatilimnocola aggregata]QDU30364.1 Cytochrome c [Anatilimnocola aggregata]
MASDYTRRTPLVLLIGLVAILTQLATYKTDAQETKPQEQKPAAVPDSVDKDYSAELPRIEPLSPADALQSFDVAPGFRLEQVAAEPLLADPVAICFDEDCRMFVVEMRGYSENKDDKVSCIRLLEDTDSDGKFDKSSIFADKLNWPTAIHCWKGGVFVADAPDLLYLKDTTGDGVADERKVVLTGFGTSNVQGLVNTFQWSLDNRIVGATSSSGAELRKPEDKLSKPISLRGRDFSLNPETLEIKPLSGGAQHGATTDRWGNRFVCSNSDHIQHVVFADADLARNPLLAAPAVRRSIAVDGPQADVFRLSPIEPWRIVRTRLRANKIVPGIVEGGGRPAGYFTSATGVTLYNGDAWPAEFLGMAFVGDVGSNIVHRKTLKPNGVSFTAHRIDEKKEFIASRDTWFRPVQFANAPDGCLYVCDMYRETIEHPLSIPPILKKHLDLTSGRDRGRIYRVTTEQFTQRQLPKLSKATTGELVATLDHANGWHRETAARLLTERADAAAIKPLEKLAQAATRPEGQIRALYLLDTFGALTDELLLPALRAEHPRVREQAVRLSASIAAKSPALRQQLVRMTADADDRVRFQLAIALGNLASEERVPALLALLRQDIANADQRLAMSSSLADGAGLMLQQLAADESLSKRPEVKTLVQNLTMQMGRQQRAEDLPLLVKTLAKWSQEKSPLLPIAIQSLAAKQDSPLARQIAVATGGQADAWMQELIASAKQTALDTAATPANRIAAVKQLRLAKFATTQEVAEALLTPANAAELQATVITTLAAAESEEVATFLLSRFDQLTPELKSRALDALISRPAWALALLQAIETKQLAAADLDLTRLNLLAESSNEEVRRRALALAKVNRPSDRLQVVTEYKPVLEQTGDATRGKEVFKKNCAACHKLQGFGHEIGPNLAAMKNRGPEAILINVLDPNREVNPQYLNYLVLTTEGRSLSGMLTAETATSVTLRKQENATDTVLRVDIEQLKSTGQSLMPVGLEKQIDRAAMTDLIEYLKTLE